MSSTRADEAAASPRQPPRRALRRDVRLVGDALGRVLVEQDGEELLADVERVRTLARKARESGSPADHAALAAYVRSLDDERSTSVLRAFGLYFQLANVAEAWHRVRSRRRYEREEQIPRESLAEAFGRLAEQRRRACRAGRAARRPSRSSSSSPRTPPRPPAAPCCRPSCTLSRILEALDDPALAAGRAPPPRGRGRRRDHRALAGRRGALAPPARRRRDPPRAVVLRDDAARRGARRARRVPRAPAGRAGPVPLRLLGRRRSGRQSRGRPAHRRREWLERARRLALTRYRVEVRAARARDRRLDPHGAGQRRAAALDRARRARARGVRARDRRPELRRAVPPQAQLRRQAPREPARAQRRARLRRRRASCSPTSS